MNGQQAYGTEVNKSGKIMAWLTHRNHITWQSENAGLLNRPGSACRFPRRSGCRAPSVWMANATHAWRFNGSARPDPASPGLSCSCHEPDIDEMPLNWPCESFAQNRACELFEGSETSFDTRHAFGISGSAESGLLAPSMNPAIPQS